jgi:predicted nucleotide-binding protein
MDTRLKVRVLGPRNENLTTRQQRFLETLIEQIERANFCILRGVTRPTAGIEERRDQIALCHGLIALAFAQWECRRLSRDRNRVLKFPTEFVHIEAALAAATKRPLLVFREKSVADRGVLRPGFTRVINLPTSLDVEWLKSQEFQNEFQEWAKNVRQSKHVFLGYSSQATEVAHAIRKFLIEKLKITVFDWHDFEIGETIWRSIERAERLTSCGIFLFMADDTVTTAGLQQLSPRDNVVYEAGYFAGAKGLSRSIIIHEEGAKVPTDLGGILNLTLGSRQSIATIETRLAERLEQLIV